MIEEGVTSLRQQLFYELTGVESVSIPSTTTSIDRNAFAGTSVIGEDFTVSAVNTEFTSVDGSLFNKNKTIEDGKTYYIGLWGMSETYDDHVDSLPFEFTYHAHKHDFSDNKQFCTCGAQNPDYVDPSTTPATPSEPSEPSTPSEPSQGTTDTPAPVTPAPSQTTEGTDTTQTPANSETPQDTVTAPKATSIKSVKGKKKSILIKWKKVKDANGYEIQPA